MALYRPWQWKMKSQDERIQQKVLPIIFWTHDVHDSFCSAIEEVVLSPLLLLLTEIIAIET